jgi:hypothetical protein
MGGSRHYDYLIAAMSRERTEQFRVLFLDTRSRLIADEVQGRGTVNHTPVYPREVVTSAPIWMAAPTVILPSVQQITDPAFRERFPHRPPPPTLASDRQLSLFLEWAPSIPT